MITDKASITVSIEYSDFKDIFSKKSTVVLSEYTEINTHVIDLEKGKQLFYGLIYSLEPIELKTLKIYIKTNLTNGFISLSESLASAPILFNKKLNRSFWLCVHYQDLNNITIKNRYSFLLVSKSLDCLSRIKQFTQFDLTSTSHRIRIKEGKK